MEDIFIKILNMSITASYFTIALLLVRAVFRKIPKWLSCVLWGLVGLRLVLPFSFESILSLIPSGETVPPDIMLSKNPHITSGIPAFNHVINPVISESFTPDPSYSVNPLQVITFILSVLWVTGIAVMLIYTLVSYILLRRKTRESIKADDGTYICDTIGSPFILGIIKPKIYVPSSVTNGDKSLIIAHEKAHIKRLDHLWKPLGFLLLSVYWFNPLMWIAYIFLCRDIEAACDEKVLKNGGTEIKKSYSQALINCSAPKKLITACPLAFGETGVKQRIKNVLSYKKPTLWLIIIALIVSIILSVCFMTNPRGTRINDIPRYEEIFKDVTKLQFFTGENTIYTTEAPTFELRQLKKVKINPEPLQSDVYGYYKIEINDRYEIHIDEGFGYLHLRDKSYDNSEIVAENGIISYDNWIRPSAVYRIEDAKKIKEFFLETVGDIIIAPGIDNTSPITDYPGIYISFDNVETKKNGNTHFNVTWHNETDRIVTHNGRCTVEYDDGTGYIKISPNATDDSEISCLVNPDSKQTTTYILPDIDLSRSGAYRITCGFSPDDGHGYITQIIFNLEKSESILGGADGPATVVVTKSLTREDVIRLATKGESLSWEDFSEYSYYEPSRGISNGYSIRNYKIDDRFSVSIVGYLDEKPYSIFLNGPGIGNSKEIRNGGVEEFIEAHEKDPVIKKLSFAQRHFPVDNTGNNFNEFINYGSYMMPVYNRLQYLPTIKIESKDELEKFKDYFRDKMDFNSSFYGEGPSFNQLCNNFDTEYADYFKNHILLITYCTTENSANFLEIGYAIVSEEKTLTLSINEIAPTDSEDDTVTGWIAISEIERKDFKDVWHVTAFLYGEMPSYNDGGKERLATYTYIESSEQVIKPYFNLYKDGTFMFIYHPLSSYIGHGTYEIDNYRLRLTTSDGQIYKFTEDNFGNYKIDLENSTGSIFMTDIVHNAVFYKTR